MDDILIVGVSGCQPENRPQKGGVSWPGSGATVAYRYKQAKIQPSCYICTTLSYIGPMTMTTLTIRLDEKLGKALDRLAKTTGRTKSELAREALKRQVAVARFRELRRRTLPFAEAQGLLTDEEVFKIVS